MIALRHGLPLIAKSNGRTACFNKQWLIHALQQAAEQAAERIAGQSKKENSHQQWSMASAIADAVTIYLQQEVEETIIKLSELEQIVKTLLISLKHDDIANCFSLPDPPVYLSLVDLVQEAGTGYELAFFQLLRKRLQEIAESSSLRLEIGDLGPCLRLLKHRLRLGRHDILREEIVNYIRRYGRSRFFRNKRRNQKPLEIELS